MKNGKTLIVFVVLVILTVYANITFADGNTGIIRFITIGDVHITNDTNSVQYKSLVQTVDYINNRTDVDFVVELGDIADSAKDNNFITAKSVLDGLNKPYYVVEGNHDYGTNGSTFTKYFGQAEHIVNINGYQLIFVGIKENNSFHWSFNYDNADKSLPTVIFNHGPVQPDIGYGTCEKSWRDSLHRYACDMRPYVNNFTKLLGYYSGHVHRNTSQMINDTQYVTAQNLEGNDFIGYTIIKDGVVNYTTVNISIPWVPLAPVATPVPTSRSGGGEGTDGNSDKSSSSGSGSSGGGCGGGLASAEPYENIYKYEVQDMQVLMTPVSFKYKNPELAVYEVMVTSTQSDMASLRIEVLKNTSKLVNISAQGIVYKNINAWIDYKRIKNATIRYKVENSWLSDKGLSSENVKMSKWDIVNNKWIELSTIVTNKDDMYTYFESQTDTFSSFAINDLKDEKVMSSSVKESYVDTKEVEQTENKQVGTESPKAPGFGIILSIVSIVSMLYMVRIRKR